MSSKRVVWIDCAKGIVILLVVVGHTILSGIKGSIGRGMIFSFHMPFFFIISGVTFKNSDSMIDFRRKTWNAARHLLIPVMVTFTINTIYQIIINPNLLSSTAFWRGRLFAITAGNGLSYGFSSFKIPGIGMTWFFVTLFIGRTLYDYIQMVFDKGQSYVVAAVISILGFCAGQKGFLPLGIDIALTMMPCFVIGSILRNYDIKRYPMIKLICFGLFWIITLYLTFPDYKSYTYLELAVRRYPLYPICLICAIAGTMFFSEVGYLASMFKRLCIPLSYLGENTLYYLLIHDLDWIWKPLWSLTEHQFLEAIQRMLADGIIFTGFMALMLLCKKNIIPFLRQRHKRKRHICPRVP